MSEKNDSHFSRECKQFSLSTRVELLIVSQNSCDIHYLNNFFLNLW